MSCRYVYSDPADPQDVRRDYAEPMSSWLRRSGDEYAVGGRAWINRMYERFPDPRHILRGNLLAPDDPSFWGAVTSLAVFDRLLSAGRSVINDEAVETTDRRPDLVIEAGSDSESVVECTALLDDQSTSARDALLAPLMDELDTRLQGSDWFVHLQPIGDFMINPPPRRIADAIMRDMRSLDPGLPLEERTYEDWNLKVTFFPSTSGISRTRPVGGCSPFDEAQLLRDDDRIVDKLTAKSPSYYSVSGVPFVLALAPLYTFYDEGEVLDVLYDRRTGFYGQPGSGRRASHSGVLLVTKLKYLGSQPIVLSLLPNPSAAMPVTPGLICADRVYDVTERSWTEAGGL